MPPAISFHANPAAPETPESGPQEIDLAGERRPRCAVTLPRAAGAGVWCGECGCGASFAVGVAGNEGDPRRLWVACWEREQQRPTAARQQQAQFNLT